MNEMVTVLRKEAARLLGEDVVDVVIGFEPGTLPMRARPVFIRRPDAANGLVISGFCRNNLAAYLTRRPPDERIGIVCRGCECRSVRALVVEQQRVRERLVVIGIPCPGILDEAAVLAETGETVEWAREEGEVLVVGTPSAEVRIRRGKVLHRACGNCRHNDPIGADITIGSPDASAVAPAKDPVEPFGAMNADRRHAFFAAEAHRCIRCYACREACPMCYCTQCFVDHTTPRWTESTASAAGNQAWHIIRAFHQAGRCASCGACERACPMGIRMTYLTDKLNRDLEDTYGFVAGRDERQQPPFARFSQDPADGPEP